MEKEDPWGKGTTREDLAAKEAKETRGAEKAALEEKAAEKVTGKAVQEKAGAAKAHSGAIASPAEEKATRQRNAETQDP